MIIKTFTKTDTLGTPIHSTHIKYPSLVRVGLYHYYNTKVTTYLESGYTPPLVDTEPWILNEFV